MADQGCSQTLECRNAEVSDEASADFLPSYIDNLLIATTTMTFESLPSYLAEAF